MAVTTTKVQRRIWSFCGSSETVIVVEPTRPEEVTWLNVEAHGLSPREEEVIRLVVCGFSNRRISESLYISENTVQRHLSNIFEKVGVRSRKELLTASCESSMLPQLALVSTLRLSAGQHFSKNEKLTC